MREANETGVHVARRGVGFSAAGPDFYVWDLDSRAVLDTAVALIDRALKPRVRKVVRMRGRPRVRAR